MFKCSRFDHLRLAWGAFVGCCSLMSDIPPDAPSVAEALRVGHTCESQGPHREICRTYFAVGFVLTKRPHRADHPSSKHRSPCTMTTESLPGTGARRRASRLHTRALGLECVPLHCRLGVAVLCCGPQRPARRAAQPRGEERPYHVARFIAVRGCGPLRSARRPA